MATVFVRRPARGLSEDRDAQDIKDDNQGGGVDQ